VPRKRKTGTAIASATIRNFASLSRSCASTTMRSVTSRLTPRMATTAPSAPYTGDASASTQRGPSGRSKQNRSGPGVWPSTTRRISSATLAAAGWSMVRSVDGRPIIAPRSTPKKRSNAAFM
jgi:hypothetical protein